MQNQHRDIKSILERYRQGTASEKDMAFLESWYMLHDHTDHTAPPYTESELLADSKGLWKKLNRRPMTVHRIAKYAAALLIVSFTALQWDESYKPAVELVDMQKIVATGNQEPTITLANGTIITLDGNQPGIKMGTQIHYENGVLVPGLSQSDQGQELFLQVPTGRTFHLVLSDNTKVWLNAGSSLKYPSNFEGNVRKVELVGEGYFEVSSKSLVGKVKDVKQGFIVQTEMQTIHVLGTHFNIKAYPHSPQRTTLLEGKVQIAAASTNIYKELLPGQEAIIRNKQISIQNTDAHASTSWISGLFNFDDRNFAEIMQDVAEWYDLEIVYEGSVPNNPFFGLAYKSDNLATVLQLLENAKIQYKVTTERKLIITNKK